MDLAIVITVVVVALAFDYTNGFHDAANAIATSVSTRALTPRVALILAAVMNFVGAFLGQKVAHTVSDVIVPPDGREGLVVVLAGLLGAIAWNLTTWYFGLPSSSSHALIGGLVGAAIAAGTSVHWHTILDKVRDPDGGLAVGRVRPGVPGDVGDHLDLPKPQRRAASPAASGWPRPSPPPRWRSATASRTRRRRWASSSWR